METRQKETLKVAVTEVLGGGRFYVQSVGDQRISSIQNQLASLSVKDAPIIGSFNPKRGDIVLAQFSLDNSWNRAMVSLRPEIFNRTEISVSLVGFLKKFFWFGKRLFRFLLNKKIYPNHTKNPNRTNQILN